MKQHNRWSPQQELAIKAVRKWLASNDQVFYLSGYSGTGKTTLARELARSAKGRYLFAAYTGKAALVMRRKGCVGASTIHSLIYKLDDSKSWEPTFTLNPGSEAGTAGLIVIDECSMVDEVVGRDLLSFGTKILVIGDPAQLPPVKGEGFFTSREPDFMLTEIHRQAQENPIIRMSMDIREGARFQIGNYGDSRVIDKKDVVQTEVLAADQILVGLNRTRVSYNNRMRTLMGRKDWRPVIGDKLVCLRNNREKKLLNGGIWTIHDVVDQKLNGYRLLITSEDSPETKPTDVFVLNEFFTGNEKDVPWERRRGTQEFTYGYALTTHKAQGSQWDDLYLFDEGSAFGDEAMRWRYTALTRAAERITIAVSGG